jgi:hypothetical protein
MRIDSRIRSSLAFAAIALAAGGCVPKKDARPITTPSPPPQGKTSYSYIFDPANPALGLPADVQFVRPMAVETATLPRYPERALAELYRDNALGFACEETIAYSGAENGRIQFAYLFIRDERGKLRDFRTWKSGTRGDEVDPRDYRVPRFLESAYLWAFIFRADRQPLYRFERLNEEHVGDRTAIVIQFLPREPIRKGLNDWAGYARVDGGTSQILEVEAYSPADWGRKVRRDAEVALAQKRNTHADRAAYDIERIVTTFGFEKNGMRLPSHVEIILTRSTLVPGAIHETVWESTLRKVTQDYAKFEFFSVRSSDEIARFVNGEGPLPAAGKKK